MGGCYDVGYSRHKVASHFTMNPIGMAARQRRQERLMFMENLLERWKCFLMSSEVQRQYDLPAAPDLKEERVVGRLVEDTVESNVCRSHHRTVIQSRRSTHAFHAFLEVPENIMPRPLQR